MVSDRKFVKFDNFVKLVANGCGLNNSPCPKPSPARHLAQAELADQIERPLFCHLGAGTRFAFPDTLRSNEARTSVCPLDKIANSIAIDLAAIIGSAPS